MSIIAFSISAHPFQGLCYDSPPFSGRMLSITLDEETSLLVQWLRICLVMKGMKVQSLVRELRFPHVEEQLSPRATTKTRPS